MTSWTFAGYDPADGAGEYFDEATGEAYYHRYGRTIMTSTEPVPLQPEPKLLETMAHEYGMAAKAFENTVRATVFPKGGTNEQLAMFLLVARRYKLNPFMKQIYAIPRGGGIQVIVPIDGWLQIINDHEQFDGMEVEEHFAPDGALIATTCKIYRKDRSHPMVKTEYLSECRMKTDTWEQWPIRMLSHKATIQCARYAFALSGIIDPDEAERFIPEARAAAPEQHPEPPPPRWKQLAAKVKETEKQDQAKIAAENTLRAQLKASVELEEKAAKDAEALAALPASDEIDIPAAYEMGQAAWHRAGKRDQWPAGFKNLPKLQEAWISGWDREEHAGGDAG